MSNPSRSTLVVALLACGALATATSCSKAEKKGATKKTAPADKKAAKKVPDAKLGTASAGGQKKYALLTYYWGKDTRVCHGDTATGELVCQSVSNQYADIKGAGEPTFQDFTDGKRLYFRYASAFPKASPGTYAFFSYQFHKRMRVCIGQTTTGAVHCRDTADESSEVPATVHQPTFEPLPKDMKVFWLRYFGWGEDPQPVGTFTFGTYVNSEGPRVCRQNSNTGVTVCATSATSNAEMRPGQAPSWDKVINTITYFRY